MRGLILVRHGLTSWNAEHRLQGQRDLPLSPTGRRQAAALRPIVAALLDRDRGVHVVCSPLVRAAETCEVLGLRPDLVDPRWQEADLGAWTGRTRADLERTGTDEYAAWRAGTFTPPQAEDHATLRERVSAAIAGLPAADLTVVVTHGGPIRAACRLLVGLEQHRLTPVEPGSATVFDLPADGPGRLRGYNITGHPGPELIQDPPD
jgi:glucosyl-3-phosphoglycerate phosphatase